jgi:hypothetical protein
MKTGRVRSDYDPRTVLMITLEDGADICVDVMGKGEFKIAGVNGGSHIPPEKKNKLIKLFSEIIDVFDGIDYENFNGN